MNRIKKKEENGLVGKERLRHIKLCYTWQDLKPRPIIKLDLVQMQPLEARFNQQAGEELPNPGDGLTLDQARRWFLAARLANEDTPLPGSSTGSTWVDDTVQVLLNMIAQRRGSGFISGHRILVDAIRYHSPRRLRDVAEEIYEYLADGNIVILDLSVEMRGFVKTSANRLL